MLKMKKFQGVNQIPKNKFNDSKWKKMALTCSKGAISIIKRNCFYCLSCLHFSRTKNKLDSYKRVRGNKDFCNAVMPSEETKILEFNQYQEADKAPFTIYSDLEGLIENFHGCKNNPENSFTTNVDKHIPSGV